MAGNLRLLVFLVLGVLVPAIAMAGDNLPQRMWSEQPGVRTLETAPPVPGAGSSAAKPTGNFVLGFQPGVVVTGEKPIEVTAAFVMKVREKWPNCELERVCGSLIYVDCHSEVDGPAYYADGKTLDVIATCGGACMNVDKPCDCPPTAWTCK
jgi:hypothetical protein